MTDHKFTDEEVIKALGCCSKVKGVDEVEDYCSICPFWDEACATLLPQNALDLINRQKAEIERLQATLDCYEETSGNKQTKAEAIKGFAERLKERAYTSSDWSHGEHPQVVECDDIDDLVKEMTEG